jgi:LmbE family N-acetylglucosaminyl deacetylase
LNADLPTPWQPLPEPELVPYRPIEPASLRSLLVLAPHPDDEVFACGGLLAIAAAQGLRTDVAIVSDGAAGGDAAVRAQESRRAAAELGYAAGAGRLALWGRPDRGVVPDAALVQRIVAALDAGANEWLLAPSPFEVHPDHRAVCLAAVEAWRQRPACRLGFFEIGQPLLPNGLLDITEVLALKQRAMRCFASQLAVQAYDEQVTALNRYRAYTLGPAVSHAEAYWFPDRGCLEGGVEGLLTEVGRLLRQRLRGS